MRFITNPYRNKMSTKRIVYKVNSEEKTLQIL
nr:MAG TPA: hypothetical protein [Caudoviricetes sp.]